MTIQWPCFSGPHDQAANFKEKKGENILAKKLLWIGLALALLMAALIGNLAPLAQGESSRATAQIAPADAAWQAALPQDPQAATAAYMARISPATKARSDAYFEGGYWLQLVNFVAGLAGAALLLSSRVLQGFRAMLERRIRNAWFLNASTATLFILLFYVLTLPLTVYQDFYREHQYGMSNLSFSAWLGEQMLALAINALIGGLVISLLYIALRRAPRSWWIWGSVLSVGTVSIMMLLGPTYIDPLFNTYQPISDAKVKAPIMAMMRANGVPVDNIYQFDASKQTNRVSANVSGIFGSAAVRLNDNLLNRTTLPEIKAVLGHELGHYTMNHMYKSLFNIGLILVLGFAFLKWSLDKSLVRWGQPLGLSGHADVAGLPLLMALFSAYMFIATPLNNTLIRVQEVEADIFGLNAAAEPIGMAEAHLKLTEYRKADPSDFEEFVFYDHPSPRKRIFSAMRWRAEHLETPGLIQTGALESESKASAQ